MKEETELVGMGLTVKELCGALREAETRSFPGGVVIGKEGELCAALYIVLEGQVKAVYQAETEVLYTVSSGECFGCFGFRETPLSASFITVESSRLLVLPTSRLEALMHGNSAFALRIFEMLALQLDKQVRELSTVVKQKTAISDILRAISGSSSNIESALNSIAENAARLCDFTNTEIFQIEGDNLLLVGKYGQHRIWPIGFSIRISRDSVIGRAALDRTLVYVDDLQEAEKEFPLGASIAKQFGNRTVCALPLLRDGVATGVVLIRRVEMQPLTEKQMALLKTFADQAAIAIENLRLFKEIQEKSRKVEEQAKELSEWNATLEIRVAEQVTQLEQFSKLEHELSLASEIQRSMLPRSVPLLDGYEFGARMVPAKSVGGDFYDFFPLGADKLGIAVGDVSDKGIPAALFMAMVRSLLRAEAHPDQPPHEVLRRVNTHLMDVNDKEMFVTILFGILNRTTNQFHYARAGHEAPIIFDTRGSSKRLPKQIGQALGVFPDVAVDEQIVALSKGCMLLIFSDGILDATNQQSVNFGQEGICRAIARMPHAPSQIVCDELIKAVSEHQAGLVQHDDMTVVAVRANGFE